jgi:hypothetical protein
MIRAIFVAALSVAASISFAAQAKTLNEQLVGTWSLSSVLNTDDSGEKSQPYSEHPLGTYMFDASGHFAEIIINPEKEGFSVDYYGTYTADESGKGFVLHVVGSSVKRFVGTDAKREVISISDDTLETNNPNPSKGGKGAVSTWKRVK